ncbi:MAG: hypothetical protein LQ350_005969 [Teloschistes chrysophthalmus]|nr:MAG: hypothetical protein LQ350_005969 [Niorma chrysophthalma]
MSSQSYHNSRVDRKPSKATAALQRQYGKQQWRKVPEGTLPDPTLGIPIDDYVSFVTYLKSSKRILALLGAGLSAASGIPTFRGVGGFWREHDAMQLATPEAFDKDPSLVWQFYNYRRHMALEAKPNRGHVALAKLAGRKPDYISFDNDNDPVVPALQISEDHDVSDAHFPIASIPVASLPHCPQCASLLRPAIVWFGEQTPLSSRERIHSWLDQGSVDLMLVVGTSATVWPAAVYIHSARLKGARIAVFNTEDPELNVDDESQKLREQDWFFKGDAAAVVPDVLKEVVGMVVEVQD